MRSKLLILICLIIAVISGWAKSTGQQARNQLKKHFSKEESDTNHQLFKLYSGSSKINVKADFKDAVFLELNYNELKNINRTKSSLLTLSIPTSESTEVTFDLHTERILTDNFSVITQKSEKVKYTPGLYYQGTIEGVSPSLAGWSMFDNSVMAVFSYGHDNYVLGVWKDKSNINNSIYILYKDSDVLFKREFKCGVLDPPVEKAAGIDNGNHLQSNQCIKIYFECDYQMLLDQGSVTNVTNYVTGMFNVVQLLYTNETINTEISQIFVWTSADPYIPNTTSNDLLNNFQATRTTFNGNVAHLLTTRNLNVGGLAYLDIICTPSSAYAISNIDNTYSAYPNYSWTIEVVTHELGHNFGSNHTHWCGWTGGAIDDCYAVEGSCSPGPTPTSGGTIMSYCHLSSTGIALTNGFGPLPGNAVRNAYNAASCLTACASPPQTDFVASSSNYCSAPATVTFTDQTIGYITSWAWDIDNNGTIDYTTQSPTHTYTSTGNYTVKLITTNANGSDTMIKTNYVIVGTVAPAVSIAITTGSNSICEFIPVTFTATPTNGGPTPTYQWYLNGSPVLAGTYPTYTSSLLANNDVLTCEVTSSAPCPSPTTAMSSSITMTVTPNVAPSVAIAVTSGSSTMCAGSSVTFTVTPTNGGSNPSYQWKVNGTNVGTNSPTFTSSTLANADLITCVLTSNATCVNPSSITSNIVPVIVNPIGSPTVSIVISSGSNPTCPGVPITFTATSTSGGSNPVYQWKKNAVNVAIGTNYTPVSPANGDVITCTVTSNAPCLSSSTATSSDITISVMPSQNTGISIAITNGTNPVCAGSTVTFTATPTNANSPTYQWYLNGGPISGAQNQSYMPSSVTNGSVITCMISSTSTCTETATSSGITITTVPIATVNFISDIDVCGGPIASITFSSNPLGADFTWTNSNTAIGLAANGMGNIPAFNAANNTSSAITSTITVTPSISGCQGTPATYSITVNPTPAITQNGTVLTSSTASSYQWYRNGQVIAGATNQTYNTMIFGDYCVVVDGGGCPSNTITIGTAGINELESDCNFTVYPNPNNGNFFISFNVIERNTYTIKIINSLGAVVYTETLLDFQGEYINPFCQESLAKGVYVVSLLGNNSEAVKKVIVY